MAGPGGRSASAAFREHLRRLGLHEFPCGAGGRVGAGGSGQQRPRGGAEDEESREARTELLRCRHSPWALPPGCGPEDQRLRLLAVRAPGLVRDTDVFLFFRVLRLVDQGVDEVDEGLLRFQRLEELVLSANRISTVASANLPGTLKVLELCGNAVSDLRDLCSRPPPPLQHLGLGHNRLRGAAQHGCLTADSWPNLVSLDLSFNALTDLLGLVSKLAGLQKLRVLLLQGNPLALLAAYRGFVVDSLPRLRVLDDVHIGPDERHRYRGLAARPELLARGARVAVHVGAVRGLPAPGAPEPLDAGADVAVVARSYSVTYEFAASEDVGSPEVCASPRERQPLATPVGAQVHATPAKPWADPMDCGYRREHAAPDLVGLKAFLEAGTILSVVEEKVLSWPLVVDTDETAVKKGKAGRGLQHGAEDTGPGDKQKKKQREKPRELRSDPPIRRTLGTGRVSLQALLTTEALVATVCDLGIPTAEEPPRPLSPEEKDRRKGKNKSKKPKEGRGSEASQGTATSAKGKGKTKEPAGPDEGRGVPPAPLTVQFQMQLLRWPAAAEAQQPASAAAAVAAAGKVH
ncbi:leucine-rich repeat-containing protein 43 [Apteryx mantelli]|uniref:Leucine-rich repeat-containing protein 43 n=1 Tax=Apteryx mantelli TaxID=2696672 RepID=A0ABM4FER8_9AVES